MTTTKKNNVRLSLLLVSLFLASPAECFVLPRGAAPKTTDSIRLPFAYNVRQDQEETKKQNVATFDPAGLASSSPDSSEVVSVLDSYQEELQSELQTTQENKEIGIWAARGILLLVAALWGTNFASVKYLENLCFHPPCHHTPSEAAFARFGVAALVSSPLLFKQRWDVILGGLECGLWITLGYIAQAMALSDIPAGKCAFICSLTVVFVPLVEAILYGKKMKPTNFVAAAFALTGVGILEGMVDFTTLLGIKPALADTGVAAASLTSSSIETAVSGPLGALANSLGVTKGDILALGQPIGFGYSFLRIEHYQEKFKDVPNRVLTIAASQCLAVGLLSLLWVLYDYNWSFPDFSYMMEPHRLAVIGWTGIMTTVVAIFLQGIALQKASPTDASITFSTEPVWASLFGFLLLREQLGINNYIGGAIIMMACLTGAASDLKAASEQKQGAADDFHP